jgi:hypothetical protein
MKVAILIPGQPRFTEDFTKFIRDLTGYEQADWFFYLTNNNTTHGVSHGVNFLTPWVNFNRDWAISKIQSVLPANNFLRALEISDCETAPIPSVPPGKPPSPYMMWYNLYQCNQLRLNYEQQANIKYDLIIRFRTDAGLTAPLDLSSIDILQLDKTVIMSENFWSGEDGTGKGCCDIIAISLPEVMNTFADLIKHAETYPDATSEKWNPERILGHHLQKNQIKYIKGNITLTLRLYPPDIIWT